MFDGWSKAVVGDVEIDEGAAHEDSGGVDLLVESVLAIDEENVQALPAEQSGTLQAGQSGADDGHVVAGSHERFAKSFVSQSLSTKKGGGAGRHYVFCSISLIVTHLTLPGKIASSTLNSKVRVRA